MLDLISDTFYSFKRGMNKFTTGFFLIFSLIGVAALIYSFVLRAEEKEFLQIVNMLPEVFRILKCMKQKTLTEMLRKNSGYTLVMK